MKLIFAAFFISTVLGCTGGNSPTSKSDFLRASSFDCEKSFQDDWCASNLESNSNIGTVCAGKIYSDDLIYRSVYLKSSSGNSCLVDLSAGSAQMQLSGCSNASKITFASAAGNVDVSFCFNSSGGVSYVEGVMPPGAAFRALSIQ
jgi:hypothetical protein